jgi:hypothetical protein
MFSKFQVIEKKSTPSAIYQRGYRQKNRQHLNQQKKAWRKQHFYLKLQYNDFTIPSFDQDWNVLLDMYQESLDKLTTRESYRKRFPMEYSFTVGYHSKSVWMNGFHTPHNCVDDVSEVFKRKRLGICQKHPLDLSIPLWKKEIYQMASLIFSLIVPHFLENEYCVHVSKMTSDEHDVPLHVDDTDISHQYILLLGSWTGADLICLDSTDPKTAKEIAVFSQTRQMVRIEGRNLHYVRKRSFSGCRYATIIYKSHDKTKNTPDPITQPIVVQQ